VDPLAHRPDEQDTLCVINNCRLPSPGLLIHWSLRDWSSSNGVFQRALLLESGTAAAPSRGPSPVKEVHPGRSLPVPVTV